MTLRIGRVSQYRNYTCSTKARQGESGFRGLTVPMQKLDRAVAVTLVNCANERRKPKRN